MLQGVPAIGWIGSAAGALVFGYLLGSIPFGLIFAQLAGAGDVRKIGSGNIGATNVLRTGKRWAAAATLLCDAGKGVVAVLAAASYGGPVLAAIAGAGALLGHVFPVWLRFRGGKGMATFVGVTFALDWRVGLVAGATWLIVAALFRISSLATLIAAAVTPPAFFLFGERLFAVVMLALVVLVFLMHRANIGRLARGAEPRIGHKAVAPQA
jgi:glycerol-3-phosphate acyltransferase PlsY